MVLKPMTDVLKELLHRIDSWPAEARDEAIDSLLEIEERFLETSPLDERERRRGAWSRIRRVTSKVRDLAPDSDSPQSREEWIVSEVEAYRRQKSG
jgi:hypothetical protein